MTFTWSLSPALSIFNVVIFAILLAAVVRVVIGTLRKDKWGINLKRTYCPRCGEKIPSVRKPAGRQQALWGGGTCPKCGCEVDKWGREVEKSNKKESINR